MYRILLEEKTARLNIDAPATNVIIECASLLILKIY
jgi:hypothetical protein